MDGEIDFQTLEHGSQEVILALHHNLYGNRLVVASGDHNLRVWDKGDKEWKLTASWRGHDSEIIDVKWNGPYTGALIGSIGTDGLCKLWLEDPTAELMSDRRFQLIHELPTKTSRPWQSLDFHNSSFETYLALTTYDGNLSVFEPREQEDLTSDWFDWFASSNFDLIDHVPSSSEEASFYVTWCPEKLPCWTAVEAGLDKKSMGLAIAAMNHVLVFRTDRERRFYLAAELTGAKDVVRSVAWSRGAMRGFDSIATASKDGIVRIYELHTPQNKQVAVANDRQNSSGMLGRQSIGTTRSGIGAGLAEMSRAAEMQSMGETLQDPSRVTHEVRLVAELQGHVGAVWHVNFSFSGGMLMSTGDDSSVRSWKQDIDGEWQEYAEIDVATFEQEQEEEESESDSDEHEQDDSAEKERGEQFDFRRLSIG